MSYLSDYLLFDKRSDVGHLKRGKTNQSQRGKKERGSDNGSDWLNE